MALIYLILAYSLHAAKSGFITAISQYINVSNGMEQI